jgi:hypothetical protein
VHAGLAQNKIVVEVSVCGFGETGDAFNGWPHPNIGSDGHVSALAMFLGRSIPGIHAGDILRAVTYVKSRNDLVSRIIGVVATNHTSAAVLHLSNIIPDSVPALVVIDDVTSYESIALSEFYNTPTWMEISGVLANYDLTDLVAGMVPRPVTVIGPTDPLLNHLSVDDMMTAYKFPSSIYESKAKGQLQLVAGVHSAETIAGIVLDTFGRVD